jgi:hypothetical protein
MCHHAWLSYKHVLKISFLICVCTLKLEALLTIALPWMKKGKDMRYEAT